MTEHSRSTLAPARLEPAEADARATSARVARPRLIIVAPLPPPLGGVQLVADMQRRSSLAQDFALEVVDTSKRRLRWAVENPTWKTPIYFLRDFARLVRALARTRPQVVIVHAAASLSLLRDWVFMITARAAGAKVVCHYHGTLHARFPSGETRAGRLAGRALMAAAHRVIVLSPTYQREMSLAWKRNDLCWAPNAADLDLFRYSNPVPPSPWLAAGERGVLFVGRLSAPKGLYDLFDAIPRIVARHPQARFVLVGVAETDSRERVIREQARIRGIAPFVRFLGSLEGRAKAAAYVTSQLIVVPSWTEGFPLVIPEAMAAGLPVIATAVGAIPHFIVDGVDGFLVAPKDPRALADRVSDLLADDALRERIARHVRDRAEREFGVEVASRAVAAAVRSALA